MVLSSKERGLRISEGQKKSLASKGLTMSDVLRRNWQDPKFREARARGMKGRIYPRQILRTNCKICGKEIQHPPSQKPIYCSCKCSNLDSDRLKKIGLASRRLWEDPSITKKRCKNISRVISKMFKEDLCYRERRLEALRKAMRTDEVRKAISEGTKLSYKRNPKLAEKGSAFLAKWSREHLGRQTYKTNARYIDALGHVVRSKWEEKVAIHLKTHNIWYSYEPIAFRIMLGNKGATYRPDFCLTPYLFIEVKGFISPMNVSKMNAFLNQYPSMNLIIVCAKHDVGRFKTPMVDINQIEYALVPIIEELV